jgi:hypothetical protein
MRTLVQGAIAVQANLILEGWGRYRLMVRLASYVMERRAGSAAARDDSPPKLAKLVI